MTIILTLIILICSAILHEIAHGYVAERLGDPTARLMGRLTLNPLKHIDPYMTVLLPLSMILLGSPIILGGAKPVPIDPFNLKEGRKDVALVSLAGPLTNILIAIIASLLYHLIALGGNAAGIQIAQGLFQIIASVNVLLGIFNMIPIPPLDGSKVFSLILPEDLARSYLRIGFIGTALIFILLLNSPLKLFIQHIYVAAMGLLRF